MTHAHFSKYPISDLSHPKVAWCRTMGTHKGDLSRNLHQLDERVRIFLLVHLARALLWGLIMHFSIVTPHHYLGINCA